MDKWFLIHQLLPFITGTERFAIIGSSCPLENAIPFHTVEDLRNTNDTNFFGVWVEDLTVADAVWSCRLVRKHIQYVVLNLIENESLHPALLDAYQLTIPPEFVVADRYEKAILVKNQEYRSKLLISKRGVWMTTDNQEHVFDKDLANGILLFLLERNIKTVCDLGCGPGHYVAHIEKSGISIAGFDGNPNTLKLTSGRCGILDLSKRISIGQYDCVLSLEVGEHIPAKYEDIFLGNIVDAADKFIILSWAIPGQGGFGHVNCRSNDYIIDKMFGHGFALVDPDAAKMRSTAKAMWFKDTIMVFERTISRPGKRSLSAFITNSTTTILEDILRRILPKFDILASGCTQRL